MSIPFGPESGAPMPPMPGMGGGGGVMEMSLVVDGMEYKVISGGSVVLSPGGMGGAMPPPPPPDMGGGMPPMGMPPVPSDTYGM